MSRTRKTRVREVSVQEAHHPGWWVGTVALVAMTLFTACGARAVQRTTIALRHNWHIRQLETDKPDVAALTKEAASPDNIWLPARMPAQVRDVLLQHGKIPDPRVSRNAAESSWVGEKDWAYACTFSSPAKREDPVFLRFKGLDTLAAVYLNGVLIGRFNNMYREYAAAVRDKLSPPGQNPSVRVAKNSVRILPAAVSNCVRGEAKRHRYGGP